MNRREKIMIGLLGAVLALLAAKTVKNQYFARLAGLDKQIVAKQNDLDRLEADQRRLAKGKEAWHAAGRRTLATQDSEAQTLFRPDIDALVQEVGLTNATVQLKGIGKVGKNGLRSLSCSVTAEGQLNDILSFLWTLHQRQYAVRCDTLQLTRVTGKDIPKNTLRLIANLDTLLLPDAKAYDLPRVAPVDLASPPARPTSRPALAGLDKYRQIEKRKVFEAWTPPVPPPGKVVGHNPRNNGELNVNVQQLSWSAAAHAKNYEVYFGETNPPPRLAEVAAVNYRPPTLVVDRTYYWKIDSINSEGVKTEGDVVSFKAIPAPATPPPQPAPPPPPPDQNLVLARIVSSPRGQQAVLEDPANKAAEDKRIEVGETFYGGTLILVHPKGAVSEKDNELRFHPLTRALRECVPLTEETQPELLNEVMKLERRAAGISQRPG
ncbi:MAG: hypothetical protein HY718_16270 [Planctomycetes bacterium]|nr:hypothetical protein [Planctomycetota bacterium]